MQRMQLVENNHWDYNIEGKCGLRMTGLKDAIWDPHSSQGRNSDY